MSAVTWPVWRTLSGRCTSSVVCQPSSKGSKLGLYTRCPPPPSPGRCMNSLSTSWQSSSCLRSMRRDLALSNRKCVWAAHRWADDRKLRHEGVRGLGFFPHAADEITWVIFAQGRMVGVWQREKHSKQCVIFQLIMFHNHDMQQRSLYIYIYGWMDTCRRGDIVLPPVHKLTNPSFSKLSHVVCCFCFLILELYIYFLNMCVCGCVCTEPSQHILYLHVSADGTATRSKCLISI